MNAVKQRLLMPRGVVRSYLLALCHNTGKAEAARYSIWWAQRMCLDSVRDLYPEIPNAYRSTLGLGSLANQAQKRARDMLRAGRAAERATGEVFECPKTAPALADASIGEGKGTSFPLWVKVSVGPYIPALPHKAFSRALRNGATLRKACEIRQGKNGGFVARVFVEYPKAEPTPGRNITSCDVGVNAGVARSDGYVGRSLRPVMQKTRLKRAEQQRQGHHRSSARSAVKQQLDREARKVVTLAHRTGATLAIESLKILGNLTPRGSIGGWARQHFGERVLQIGGELGVAVKQDNPAYTSQTCLRCGWSDPDNRRGIDFVCVRCGYVAHADTVGARNIQRKALGRFRMERKPKGRVKNTVAQGGHNSFSGGGSMGDSFVRAHSGV